MSTKAIRKPKVRMWERIMLLHAPWISRYALRKLEKWYFEDEPRLYTASLQAAVENLSGEQNTIEQNAEKQLR